MFQCFVILELDFGSGLHSLLYARLVAASQIALTVFTAVFGLPTAQTRSLPRCPCKLSKGESRQPFTQVPLRCRLATVALSMGEG